MRLRRSIPHHGNAGSVVWRMWIIMTAFAVCLVVGHLVEDLTKADTKHAARVDSEDCLNSYEYNHLKDAQRGADWQTAAIALRLYDLCVDAQIRDIQDGRTVVRRPETLR